MYKLKIVEVFLFFIGFLEFLEIIKIIVVVLWKLLKDNGGSLIIYYIVEKREVRKIIYI